MFYLNTEKLKINTPEFSEVVNAYIPSEVYIPIYDDRNYKIGTSIKEGQVISQDGNVAIHSSVPGKIEEVRNITLANGKECKILVVKMQGTFSYVGKKEKKIDWTSFSSSEILSKLEENGVYNTFFEFREIKSIIEDVNLENENILAVRLFDYDPSCSTDSFLSVNFFDKVLEGAFILGKVINATKIIFFYNKEQKFSLNSELNLSENANIASEFIQVGKKKYSFGTKEELNTFLKKSNQVANAFADASMCLEAYEAVVLGRPVLDKYVQVSGSVLGKEVFFKVKKGTPIKKLIEECDGCKKHPQKVIVNGVLKGVAISSSSTPITSFVKSITLLSSKEAPTQKQVPCIRCGDCHRICPVGLRPHILFEEYLYDSKISEEYEATISKCTQCGRCNTVCPSRLPLFQTISILSEK